MASFLAYFDHKICNSRWHTWLPCRISKNDDTCLPVRNLFRVILVSSSDSTSRIVHNVCRTTLLQQCWVRSCSDLQVSSHWLSMHRDKWKLMVYIFIYIKKLYAHTKNLWLIKRMQDQMFLLQLSCVNNDAKQTNSRFLTVMTQRGIKLGQTKGCLMDLNLCLLFVKISSLKTTVVKNLCLLVE